MQSRHYIQTLLIAVVLTACSAETPGTAETQDELMPAEAENVELVEYLFVQHARSVTLKDGLLTLEGVADTVLFFSDRPVRIMGRESVEDFMAGWHVGETSFAESPPNAVLTVLDDREPLDLGVVLKHPVLTDRTLVYTVEVLDGPESGSGIDAALFIDVFGLELNRLPGRLGDGVHGFADGLRGEPGRPGERGEGLRGGEPGRPGEPGEGLRGGEPGRPGEPGEGLRGGEPGVGGRRAREGSREIHRGGADARF